MNNYAKLKIKRDPNISIDKLGIDQAIIERLKSEMKRNNPSPLADVKDSSSSTIDYLSNLPSNYYWIAGTLLVVGLGFAAYYYLSGGSGTNISSTGTAQVSNLDSQINKADQMINQMDDQIDQINDYMDRLNSNESLDTMLDQADQIDQRFNHLKSHLDDLRLNSNSDLDLDDLLSQGSEQSDTSIDLDLLESIVKNQQKKEIIGGATESIKSLARQVDLRGGIATSRDYALGHISKRVYSVDQYGGIYHTVARSQVVVRRIREELGLPPPPKYNGIVLYKPESLLTPGTGSKLLENIRNQMVDSHVDMALILDSANLFLSNPW